VVGGLSDGLGCLVDVGAVCYDPPQFFSSSSDPLLVTLSTSKKPLPDLPPKPEWNEPVIPEQTRPVTPQWTKPSQVVMTRSPSPAMSIYPSLDLPPIPENPLVPWNTHQQEYSSMDHYTEPPIVIPEHPLEDSPIEDAPTVYYLPDIPEGPIHTLHPERSPAAPWKEHYEDSSPPLLRKRSVSPTSPSSAPIRQRTSREGSYHSITPTTSSPIAGTSPQNQGNQSTSLGGSADNPSSTQSSADDADSDMALNWVTINTDYLKG